MKKNIIAILIFVVVIVASIASVMILKNDKTKYTMNYTAEDNKLYVIKLFENKITVSSNDRENCLNDICNENGYTFRVTFNEDNTDKVYEVFKELFTDDEKTKDIAFSAISSEQKKILNAVVVNDDSTLTTDNIETPVEKPENKKELIFTIKSDRINCKSIILKVFDDKTYEIEKTEKDEKPLTGTYDFDVQKIIDSNDNYEKNEHGTYTLTTKNNETIAIYDSNEELNSFLDKIKVKLDTCMDLQ